MAKYEIVVSHAGLGRSYLVKGNDPDIVYARAQDKAWQFDQQWKRHQAAQEKRDQKEHQESRREEATEMTEEAGQALLDLEGLLAATLDVDDRLDFDKLIDRRPFATPQPAKPSEPNKPQAPRKLSSSYYPLPIPPFEKLMEFLAPSRKQARLLQQSKDAAESESDAAAQNTAASEKWRLACLAVDEQVLELERAHVSECAAWQLQADVHDQRIAKAVETVHDFKSRYEGKDPAAVVEYFELVLGQSKYPDALQTSFDLQYVPDSRELVIDFLLPTPTSLPTVKSYKYLAAEDEMVPTHLTEAARRKLFDSVVYQLALRTLHEVFEADTVDALAAATFIGRVEAVNRPTGALARPAILSISVAQSDFNKLNLAAVEPKACVKQLRAKQRGQPHELADIQAAS